ncbi:MAG TPA: LysR family transcriptional regulator [Ottowia sp.]|uniref:LysR family transcriptional regulator n=1 Tax=Ottowia sp. TaxID=1898956 RepID=UPI002D179B44|nr:LysR family transcriptional regulator [Ottowia sp.]HMN22169.1 LysR family transcriptional regulator [Ottowia sp.]
MASPLRLTLRQLQVFAAVARGGSTSAAGAAIGLSQSATSAALKELERMLGIPLFDRTGKRLLLNADGRALLPRAQALLDGAAEIERQARGVGAALAALRVGASTTIGNYLLPRLLRRLWSDRPPGDAGPWHAQVRIGNTAEIAAAVADFSLDIGLIEGPCDDPRLETRPWLRDELLVVAAPRLHRRLTAHRPAGAAVPLQVLREQVWLLREAGSGTRAATDLALLPQLHAWRRSIELGNSEAIKHAAAEGLGLACLSEWVVADLLAARRLQRVATTLPKMPRQCYFVLHRHKHHTHALDRLVALLHPAGRNENAQPRTVGR